MITSLLAFVTRCLAVLAGSFVVVFVFQMIRWAIEPFRGRLRKPQKGDLWKDIDGRLIAVLDRNGDELNLCRYIEDPTIGRAIGCWRENMVTFQDRIRSHKRRYVENLDPSELLAQYVAANQGRKPEPFRPQVFSSPRRED